MNKIINYLKKYRKTTAYKWLGYVIYLELFFIICLYLYFKNDFSGLGFFYFFNIFGTSLLITVLSNIITLFIGIFQLNKNKLTNKKIHIIHDIGAVLCLLFYFAFHIWNIYLKYFDGK